MKWKVPLIWQGEDVWIIGGGPSVPRQFGVPEEIINQVLQQKLSPSAYSPYMQPIHSKHVIGVNAAFMIGGWIDILFFGDNSFFKKYGTKLAKYPGLVVTIQGKYSDENIRWIKVLLKDKKHPVGISSDPKLVSWNHNSGAASISVAANMGVKRIFLLGFDMNLTDGTQWWHGVYKKAGDRTDAKLPFNRHLRGFEQIKKDADKRGIEIINVNPKSDIEQFKKVNLRDVL